MSVVQGSQDAGEEAEATGPSAPPLPPAAGRAEAPETFLDRGRGWEGAAR